MSILFYFPAKKYAMIRFLAVTNNFSYFAFSQFSSTYLSFVSKCSTRFIKFLAIYIYFFKYWYITNNLFTLFVFFPGALLPWTGSILAWCVALFLRLSLVFSELCLFFWIHCHLHLWFTPQFCWSTFFSSLLRKIFGR